MGVRGECEQRGRGARQESKRRNLIHFQGNLDYSEASEGVEIWGREGMIIDEQQVSQYG